MTNLENLTQIDTIAELLYDTDSFDYEYCHDCQCEDRKIRKADCMKCIRVWLNKEAPYDRSN